MSNFWSLFLKSGREETRDFNMFVGSLEGDAKRSLDELENQLRERDYLYRRTYADVPEVIRGLPLVRSSGLRDAVAPHVDFVDENWVQACTKYEDITVEFSVDPFLEIYYETFVPALEKFVQSCTGFIAVRVEDLCAIFRNDLDTLWTRW